MSKISIIFVAVIVGIMIFLISCSQQSPETKDKSIVEDSLTNNEYNDISATEFKNLIEDENVFVLDVHIPEQKHIPGTDALIPYDQIVENLDKLPEDKDATIAIYCRSGSMSNIASETLAELGYTDINNLEGGINAWKAEGYPVEE